MDIRDTRTLKTFAGQRLEQTPEQKRIVLIYSAITLVLSALVTVITYCLNVEISRAVGLSRIGNRAMLSTLQTILPMAQSIFLMCLDLGYIAAMLRIARGQYTSPNTLRLGFDRFWLLLRTSLLQTLIYTGICIAVLYVGMLVYLMTPLGSSVMDIVLPFATESALSGQGTIVLDDASYMQMMDAMLPCMIVCCLLVCAVVIPISYRYRMANYIIIDKPATTARAALRESRQMMKGNCLRLFRLDLGLWWYYAAMALASVVCYGDEILPMLGIALPFSETVGYFLFYGLFLVLEFVLYYFLRNRVEVTYALAYDAVKPEEKPTGGVVLGNIFQM